MISEPLSSFSAILFLGLKVRSEQVSSINVPIMSVQDHLVKLRDAATALITSGCANIDELSRHIDLFSNLDLNKKVAEWEFAQYLTSSVESPADNVDLDARKQFTVSRIRSSICFCPSPL